MAEDFPYRIGHGVDVHRLVAGRELIIGGVVIPHEKGLDGHSDADVLLHAITDAILGAVGESDIGVWFPNSDPRWKDASSSDLLSSIWCELEKNGWRIGNIDCSIIAEAPKLLPFVGKMKKNISRIFSIDISCCGIKATTSEKLGYEGREEGITAYAVVLLRKVPLTLKDCIVDIN